MRETKTNYKKYQKEFEKGLFSILSNNKEEIKRKKKTAENYKTRLRTLIKYLSKYKVDIKKLDKYDVEKLFIAIQSNGYKRGGKKYVYSKATMRLFKIVGAKFFEYLKSEKVIDRNSPNPFLEQLKTLKLDTNKSISDVKDKVLSEKEYVKVLDYILNGKNRIKNKQKLYNAVIIMLCFGLRVDELSRIERSDFEYTTDGILRLHIKPSKRGKERDTYYIFGELFKNDIDTILQVNEFNFKTKTIKKQIERIKHALNIPSLSPHSLRHTFATTFLTAGGSIETLSKLLGHSDIKTTQIYGQIVNSRIENEIGKLNYSNILVENAVK